jgi:dsRNA-specific ribonuclease
MVIGDGFRSLIAAVTIDQNLKTGQALCRDFLLPVLKTVDITVFLNLQYPLHSLRRILQSQNKPAPELKCVVRVRACVRVFKTVSVGMESGASKLMSTCCLASSLTHALRIVSETGRKTHLPTFVVGVFSGDQSLGEGAGFSISMAEGEVRPSCVPNRVRPWPSAFQIVLALVPLLGESSREPG